MTYEGADRDGITVMAEDVAAVLGRMEHLFDGPLGHDDRRRAEIEMIRQDVIAALNLPKAIRDTPAGDKMVLRLLRERLLAANDVAFGSNETRC